MHIEPFYDDVTGTVSYVLADTASGQVAVIDPVLDFEPKSGTLTSASSDRIIDYVRAHGWQVQWILETHAHADHLSGAQHIRHHLGGQIAIGTHIRTVQQMFRSIFHFERGFLPDGSQFDRLLADGERFQVGGLTVTALHVPGHTPADMAYQVEDAVFVGDTLFLPDVGTARATFRVAMPRSCTTPSSACWPCHPPHACSSATTTRPRAVSRPGPAPWPTRRRAASTCATVSPRPISSPCAPPAMPRWPCPR
ncbi:MBL fold metallo-hydrolase [Comamonas sp. GCA5]